MLTSINTRQNSESGLLPSEILRAQAVSGVEQIKPQLAGRDTDEQASPSLWPEQSTDRVSITGGYGGPAPETAAQEQAYLALGRRALRNNGEEASMLPWPPASLPQPVQGQHLSGFRAYAPESEGVSSAAASGSPSKSAQHKLSQSDTTGLVGGGMEARSGERSFMGAASGTTDGGSDDQEKEDGSAVADGAFKELTEEEEKEVQKLQARDREVRSHEQAHISAAGGLALGGAKYEMEQGPDGNSYAVGGEVQIDTSPANSPDATIAKARQVKAAALAPAQPSGQDRQVAAKATQMEAEARQEKLEESRANGEGAEGATQASERSRYGEEKTEGLFAADAEENSHANLADAARLKRAGSAYQKQEQTAQGASYGGARLSYAV